MNTAAMGLLWWGVAAVGPGWAEEPLPSAAPIQEEAAVDLESLYQQAIQAQKKNDSDHAITLLTQILERDPQQAKAYLARAKLYGALNRSDLAIADYRQVVALDSKNASAYGSLGWRLILDGRFKEAREVTEKAHILAPDVFAWLINLGNLALLAGDREQARAYYRQGLERIQSNEQFEKGPVADLELFIQNGWAVEAARQELVWLRETLAPRQRWLTFKQQTEQAYQAGDYPTAEKAARAALEVAETTFGPDHFDVATSLNNLAALYYTQGQYVQTEPLLQRALAINEKALGPDHPDVAQSLNNLAVLYHDQGQSAKAEPLHLRALAIREKALGPDHPEVATLLNNLAKLYYDQGQYAQAEPLYRRALVIRRKALDPDYSDVAISLNNLAELYRAQGRYAQAEPLYRRARAINEKALGPDHPDVAQSLNNLALLYHDQGRYSKAEPLLQRALAIREKVLGPDHPDVAQSLNNLAVLYHDQGQYAQAEPLYRRVLVIRRKALDPDHPDVASSLDNLAVLYHAQGRYAEAEPLYRRARAIWEKAFGPDHPDVAKSLNNLAVLYDDQGQSAQAEPLHLRALAIREKVLGPDHPDVAQSLNNLALLYHAQGRYAKAEPLLQRALAIREKVLGPNHPDVANSLHNLAGIYHTQGQSAKAKSLHQRALAIWEKALGPNHPDVAKSLNNLAVLYDDQGQYAQAEPLYFRALAIREKALGPDHPDMAQSLNNLAVLYHTQGQYAQAEPLHQRALAIWEKALGPNHPDVATSLNNLAELYHAQGRYAEAEPLYLRALAILENSGPNHPDVATSFNKLAALYHDQGQSAKAEPLYRRALAIYEKALGPNHPDVATSLNNLALFYYNQGQSAQIEPLYLRALAIYEKALGPDHPDVATLLNNLAMLYHNQGQSAKAELLYHRALAIMEKALGPDHPDTAMSLNNLAVLYDDQGQYAQAEPLYRRAVAIVQHTDTPAYLLLHSRNLGRLLVQRGQLHDALSYYRTAADTLDRLFNQTQGLSEDARLTFLGQYAYVYREFLDLLLTLHEQDVKAGYDREFLAVASRNQSRIFSELLRQGDVTRFATDPAFIALRDQRQTLLTQLGGLREKHATLPITAPNYAGQKADLQTRIDALTAELAPTENRLWRDYPRFMELLDVPRPVTVEQLQQTLLKPDEALFSLVLLPERTVLLAVTHERFLLQVSPLTRAAVTAHVRAIRQGLIDNLAQLETLEPNDLYALYQGLIVPVEPVLKDAERILVVADGPLYSLPLELLITGYDNAQRAAFREARNHATGRPNRPPYLGEYALLPYLAERYAFRYLPSLAALASQRRYPKPPVPVTHPLVAFADPVFSPAEHAPSATPSDTSAVATHRYNPATQQTLTLLNRSGSPADDLQRLPDTTEEAQTIAALVPGRAQLYLREKAQEHTVKTLSQSGDLQGLRYLLFATHGLLGGEFLPPAPEPNPQAWLDSDRITRTMPREPLGQPALVLTLAPALENEDGFLTLKDIIEDLDLNTDLVILSACNTAGNSEKSTTGEGFAGLTRAFLFAGARHLWVSHWYVESAAARDLTTAAIRVLEAGQTDPAIALAQAQQTLRASVVETNPDTQGHPLTLARAHPYFWAPFVTVGD
ncbi:MAG TPA: tetratricopeptide repeat protein [Candidatus Competibacter sp.]|nr:tetratricopeptide repeat protein [Candidatus Competibacter sp.]HRX62669.1 tetratricopeptide repeat protein [Candidatus Competibacter sp.]